MDDSLRQTLNRIRIVFMDVDGTLTDGRLYYTNSGERMRSFFVRDGMGIKLLQKAGVRTAWITGLSSALVRQRADDLGISYIVQDCHDKDTAAEKILTDTGLSWKEAAHIGDDVIDIALMKKAGLGVAVADAAEEVKQVADYVTKLPGGHGAVRELCDLILDAQD